MIARAEFTYCEHAPQTSRFTSSNATSDIDYTTSHYNRISNITSNSSNENEGVEERHHQRQSNTRRYRTTGKIIVKQRQCDLNRRRRRYH